MKNRPDFPHIAERLLTTGQTHGLRLEGICYKVPWFNRKPPFYRATLSDNGPIGYADGQGLTPNDAVLEAVTAYFNDLEGWK